MLPAVYIGTIGVQILNNEQTASPFTSIIGALLGLGGFPMVLGYIALTASLAAIMSTTDSLINAISQLITMELFWPAFPNVSPRKIAWAGRITSRFVVYCSTYWYILERWYYWPGSYSISSIR